MKTHMLLSTKIFITISISIMFIIGATVINSAFFSASLVEEFEIHTTQLSSIEGDVKINDAPVTGIKDLKQGDKITVGKGARATIKYPDDSVSRLTSETEIVLEQIEFDDESGDRNVKIKTIFGEVYTKVVKLLSLNSSYEVKTETTVAAIRGSALNFKVDKAGEAQVIAAEHTVEIASIDPVSKKVTATTRITEGYAYGSKDN